MARIQPRTEVERARDRAYYETHKESRKAQSRAYYAANKEQWAAYRETNRQHNDRSNEKRPARDSHLRKKYGITADEFDLMLASQDAKCASCGVSAPDEGGRGRTFHVDHDHATGVVRGLLCKNCNIALGHVRDSVDTLMALAAYLLQSQNVLKAQEAL